MPTRIRFGRATVTQYSVNRLRWWIPLLALPAVVILTWNTYWIVRQFIHLAVVWDGSAIDWLHLAAASRQSNPYDEPTFRWSPVAALLLQPIVALGITAWRAAQVAAVLTIRDWRVILVILLSAPFWMDVVSGQAITFVMVAAWHALNGSRVGTWVFLTLAMLMPRPLMLPVLAWLLWKRPETRPWLIVLFVGHLALVVATGLLGPWLVRLLASAREVSHINNMAPSQWIGWAWVPIGLLLAAWLTLRGRLGLASVAVSPYVFPYYLLMLALELVPRDRLVVSTPNNAGQTNVGSAAADRAR